jgi:hypothetical protein
MTKKSSRQLARTWPFKRYSAYQRELRDVAERWFAKKGFAINPKKHYELKSHDDWPKNIICADVTKYIQEENEKSRGKKYFPLHKDLHHGLSSQAMTFNLLGPLIVREDLEPLRTIIEQAGIKWPTGEITTEFEYDDRSVFNEDVGQPTSIDLAISGETEGLFVEVKYTEARFGGCGIFSQGDCDGRNPVVHGFDTCYLHHIGRRFWELMKEFSFGETGFVSGPICLFANYYQFFREILFSLSERGSFVLLYDERSPVFVKTLKNGKESGVWPLLMRSVPVEHFNKVGRITMQQLVTEIEKSGHHNDWIDEFKSKYGTDNRIQANLE